MKKTISLTVFGVALLLLGAIIGFSGKAIANQNEQDRAIKSALNSYFPHFVGNSFVAVKSTQIANQEQLDAFLKTNPNACKRDNLNNSGVSIVSDDSDFCSRVLSLSGDFNTGTGVVESKGQFTKTAMDVTEKGNGACSIVAHLTTGDTKTFEVGENQQYAGLTYDDGNNNFTEVTCENATSLGR